jgi:hypothetical protein
VISATFSARHPVFSVTVCTASHQRRLYPHLHHPDRGSEMTVVGWPKSRWPKPAPTENNKPEQSTIHLLSQLQPEKVHRFPLNQLHPFREESKTINDMSEINSETGQEEWITGENDTIAVDITYCNPDAKVVLISSDKVELRVDAWLMSRQRYAILSMTRSNADLSVNSYEA